jgi:hypothetical protein
MPTLISPTRRLIRLPWMIALAARGDHEVVAEQRNDRRVLEDDLLDLLEERHPPVGVHRRVGLVQESVELRVPVVVPPAGALDEAGEPVRVREGHPHQVEVVLALRQLGKERAGVGLRQLAFHADRLELGLDHLRRPRDLGRHGAPPLREAHRRRRRIVTTRLHTTG